jgi:hypothetical protein
MRDLCFAAVKMIMLTGCISLLGFAAIDKAPRADEAAPAAPADGTAVLTIKRSPTGQEQHIAPSALARCEEQWTLADRSKTGVIAGDDVAYYNSKVRSEKQQPLPEGSRLNRADFLTLCSSTDVRE